MKKGKNLFNLALIILFIISFAFSVITAFYDVKISFIELGITTVLFGLFIVFQKVLKREAFDFLTKIERKLSPHDFNLLESFPLPICVVNSGGEIVWHSKAFLIDVLLGQKAMGNYFKNVFPCFDLQSGSLTFGSKHYSVYTSPISDMDDAYSIYYFIDNTELKKEAEQFYLKRPVVIQILIDNFDELLSSANGSEKSFLPSRIESVLEKGFVNECRGILRKIEKDRFVAIIDSEHLDKLISDKFEILNKVHKVATSGHINATVSMGIGKGAETILESDTMASQALDMALGRGGDQVAVKSSHGFEFFGGLSKGVEKRAKVRSRMIASALKELVMESENIVIMGHKMADFDCLGAASGLLKIISSVSKPVHICIDRERNLSKELVAQLVSGGYDNKLISPKQAIDIVNQNTLLIVVDTHNPDFVECRELLEMSGNTVVIDHHRKMVNFIDNAVIFYHEPNASSTCEMVTELVQYFNDGASISRLEAEALLSGIMLDTKNFIIKSGVRTFEAAAYLRNLGAELVRVNSWFANSIETYHQRAKLISASEVYKGCAVTSQDEFSPELLLAAPQTADELLHIKNVSASFVMYLNEGIVSVSARSYGAVNVQLVMEKLGGGGHLTMAGAQIPAKSCSEVREKLICALDEYFKDN